MFKSDSCQVHSRYFHRTNFQRGATDTIEIAEVLNVGLQTATVGQRGNTIINEDVAVRPFHIVLNTPTRELLILKLAIFSQKRNSQYGIGEHISGTNIGHNFHKDFLELADFVNSLNHKRTIREFTTAKQRLQVRSIKYRYVGESTLDAVAHIRLIHRINKALDVLACMVFRRTNIVPALYVFLPEVVHIGDEVRQTTSTGTSIGYKTDIFFYKINKSFKMLGRFVVE